MIVKAIKSTLHIPVTTTSSFIPRRHCILYVDMTTSTTPRIPSLGESYPRDMLVQYIITPYLDNTLEYEPVILTQKNSFALLLIIFVVIYYLIISFFVPDSIILECLAVLPFILELVAFATLIPYSKYLRRKLERQAFREPQEDV